MNSFLGLELCLLEISKMAVNFDKCLFWISFFSPSTGLIYCTKRAIRNIYFLKIIVLESYQFRSCAGILNATFFSTFDPSRFSNWLSYIVFNWIFPSKSQSIAFLYWKTGVTIKNFLPGIVILMDQKGSKVLLVIELPRYSKSFFFSYFCFIFLWRCWSKKFSLQVNCSFQKIMNVFFYNEMKITIVQKWWKCY